MLLIGLHPDLSGWKIIITKAKNNKMSHKIISHLMEQRRKDEKNYVNGNSSSSIYCI